MWMRALSGRQKQLPQWNRLTSFSASIPTTIFRIEFSLFSNYTKHLKDGGQLILIDRALSAPEGPPADHLLPIGLDRELTHAGFTPVTEWISCCRISIISCLQRLIPALGQYEQCFHLHMAGALHAHAIDYAT